MSKRPARVKELLDGALRAFARGGYSGTSTTEIAKEVGVSQPYIVSAFGGKESLFVETHRHAGDKILAAFGSAGVSNGGVSNGGVSNGGVSSFDPAALGRAYRTLVLEEPDALRMYNHGFAAAHHPAIGVEVRRLFAEIYRTLENLGADPVRIRDFMGRGFVINTVLAMDLPGHADDLGLNDFLAAVLEF